MLRSARYLFPSHKIIAKAQVAALFFTLTLSVALAPALHATAIAMGSITVTNFTITPVSGNVAFGVHRTDQRHGPARPE